MSMNKLYERISILSKIEYHEMSQKGPIGEKKIESKKLWPRTKGICSTLFYSLFKKSKRMNKESLQNFFWLDVEKKHFKKVFKYTKAVSSPKFNFFKCNFQYKSNFIILAAAT